MLDWNFITGREKGIILELPYRFWGQMRLLMLMKYHPCRGKVFTVFTFVLLTREALKIKVVLGQWWNDTDRRKP